MERVVASLVLDDAAEIELHSWITLCRHADTGPPGREWARMTAGQDR